MSLHRCESELWCGDKRQNEGDESDIFVVKTDQRTNEMQPLRMEIIQLQPG